MTFYKRLRVRVRRWWEGRPRGVGERKPPRPWRSLAFRRAAVVVGAVVVVTFAVTPGYVLRRPRLKEGVAATVDVVAPYRFAVEKEAGALMQEREDAAAAVLPLFRENRNIAGISRQELREFFAILRQLGDTYKTKNPAEREAFLNELSVDLPRETLIYLLENPDYDNVRAAAEVLLDKVYEEGVVDVAELDAHGFGKTISLTREGEVSEKITNADELLNLKTAAIRLRELAAAEQGLTPDDSSNAAAVAAMHLRANLVYDAAETERRRRAARDAVDPIERWYDENDKIIERNKTVTRAQIRAVEALYSARSLRNLAASMGGRFLLVVAVGGVLALFFGSYRRELFKATRFWVMVAVVISTSCLVSRALSVMLSGYSELSLYLFSCCLGAMLITLLMDVGSGFVSAVALAFLAGVMAGASYRPAVVSFAAAAAGVYFVSRLRHRSDFYRAFFGMAAAAALVITALGLINQSPWPATAKEVLWGAVMAAASVVILAILLPMFEMTFQVVTDLKLLELADLNQPLLKKLLIEAPGTYHHSAVVGNLAEVAAAAVGENPLLARVAAYYHDVGKLRAPTYFAENASPEVRRHENLSPQMSTLVVAAHTKQGAKMAEEAGLPPVIQEAIAEHHGTSLISFFYHEALKLDEHKVLDEDDFRYPGPKPHSKIAAVIMLADAAESATRALEAPTPTAIRSTVEKIVQARLEDGQLDECDLSLREIRTVKESLIKALNSVYHIRPAYPNGGEPAVVPYLSPSSAETKSN